jgi:hypothetical protein
VRRHDPLWCTELCPARALNQIQLMLGCFCCACGYVGNALALSTYPQAGPAWHAAGWPLPEGGRDAWRLFRSITTTRFDGWRPPVQRIAASARRANSWDPSLPARRSRTRARDALTARLTPSTPAPGTMRASVPPGGAASSRPPKGRGPDGPAHSGMLEGGLVGRTLWRLKRGPQGPDGPLPIGEGW